MDFGNLAKQAFNAYESNQGQGQQQQHGGGGGSGSQLMDQAMSFINQRQQQGHYDDASVNEDELKQAHEQVRSDQPQHPDQIGQGAAVAALQQFVSGGLSSGHGSGGSGGMQSQFAMMAMEQAGKFFDQKHQNGQVKGDGDPSDMKQQAMKMAGDYAMKMFMKGGSGGSPAGLMGLAEKFMG